MILAVDTYYDKNKAKTVALIFENWNTPNYTNKYVEDIEISSEYVPGEFYKRELPCILSILKKVNLDFIEFIIVDGYVFLDDFQKYGLGGYLYESLNKKIPIIGVAKTKFALNNKNKIEILRGESKNPLFITSIGIDLDSAKDFIIKMFGNYRIPKLLKELDQMTKQKTDFITTQ